MMIIMEFISWVVEKPILIQMDISTIQVYERNLSIIYQNLKETDHVFLRKNLHQRQSSQKT
jgi:hypothetical protein